MDEDEEMIDPINEQDGLEAADGLSQDYDDAYDDGAVVTGDDEDEESDDVVGPNDELAPEAPQFQYQPHPVPTQMLTDAERAEIDGDYGEGLADKVAMLVQRGVNAALANQQHAQFLGQQMGVDSEFRQVFGNPERFLQYVDPMLHGTQDGMRVAMNAAIAEAATQSDDPAAVYALAAQVMGKGKQPKPQAPVRQTPVMSPAQRPTASRSAGTAGPQVKRQPASAGTNGRLNDSQRVSRTLGIEIRPKELAALRELGAKL